MTPRSPDRETAGHRPARDRAALVALLAILGWTLTGCGDPDDDDGGGGGGGYVAEQLIGHAERP